MTESTVPQPTENVARGLLFSLGSIVVGIAGFIILSGVIGIYGTVTGVVAIAIPLVSAWLYTKGAGTPVKAGRGPWIAITAAAVIIGALTSLLAGAYSSFTRVGGDGGFFAPAFWRTVSNLAGNPDFLIPIVITLAAGGFGIFLGLRGPRPAVAGRGTANPNRSPPAAMPGDAATPASPPAPPASGASGVILNGKPVEDEKP
jgi:hypothetical protein